MNLPEDVKGTHMSRFVQLLNEHDRPIDATNFGAMVTAMVTGSMRKMATSR